MIRKSSGLPPRVYAKHSAYYLVTLSNKWVRLCSLKDGLPAMYRALAKVADAELTRELMPGVISRWYDAKRPEWADKTADDQRRIADQMAEAFAEFDPSQVTTPVCAKYLGGYATTKRTYNLHRTMLRQVLAFAALEGLREGHNPVDNIPPKKLEGRHRVVTDDEVRRLKEAAAQQPRNGHALVQMIELAMLTGQRIGDVIKLRWQDVTDQGLMIDQGKGQGRTKLLVKWSPALRAAIAACGRGGDKIGHVLKSERGTGYTYGGLRSSWERLCERAKVEDLHIHDLRGRAGVDAMLDDDGEEDIKAAQRLLGHKSEGMTRHYVEGKYHKRVKPSR
ncbi:tyrosine-type recombinase/integrase [Roseateles sp. BYS96W]|uniref:Tyrosine-type recombinase/integrase n=1 Tax=Pelomonas nitida TaxID=3299027 RepID=A0ABW7G7J3_9BURK